MWKNALEPGGPQMTTWRMCIACWITQATNTNSEYVILIAFPLQQCLNESASMLYVHCLSCLFKNSLLHSLFVHSPVIRVSCSLSNNNKHLSLTLYFLITFNFNTPSSNHAGLLLSYLSDILYTAFYPN
jgi:hypothetical protein